MMAKRKKLIDKVKELKQQGKTVGEIAKSLKKPYFVIRAIYNIV